MPSDRGPTDPRRPRASDDGRDARGRDDWDAEDDLGPVHEQRSASDYYDDDPYDDYDDGPRLLARRLVQGGVALLAVVLFLGVVWYAYTWGSRSAATGDVPVVAAPEGPEKVEPKDPGGMDVPHQDKLLLNQDGEGNGGQVERLLPPPEEPRPPAQSQPAQPADPQQGEGTPPADGGDGRQVADLPETTVPDQSMPEAGTGGTPPESDGDAQSADGATRTPERKPGGDGASGSQSSQTETAAADPAQSGAEATGQPDRAPAEGRFAVQLAAFTSEQAARQAWSSYQQRFPDILGGQQLLLQNAEVNGQMFWRVRTGPFADRSAAQSLCNRLQAEDQACLPVTR
ncbi:hypothetical protein CKO28_09895 [Rhodovibrio sodomensis]|uniref:SPOR domain-containing protein n=1 Tax=Rhodovibrio sodomensis TaxID=1088 RepID=A0ABS1DG22_9PROT|nr:SPOR domain-containing protein [Rhodovibrio sodomensis]MBK1668345.1 hypothetical protein [Rhodovibrio sodomensis]